jgi:hypothetical protein
MARLVLVKDPRWSFRLSARSAVATVIQSGGRAETRMRIMGAHVRIERESIIEETALE